MKYDVDYFLAKFSAIPEDRWTTGSIGISDLSPRKCALGHCGVNSYSLITDEALALAKLLKQVIELDFRYSNEFDRVWFLNDSTRHGYTQPTPKQRVLAALRDIKANDQPSYPDLTKSLAVLPEDKIEVDVKVKQPVK
jgi:hypothetical protein